MKANILYIEDNEQNLYLVTFLLQRKGYEVLQARDGLDGIEKAAEYRPDLILLDIQLPRLDGYAVAQRLREHPRIDRAIPILALTSYAMPGDEARALAAGCTGYIMKPIDPDTFVSEVERHLSSRRPPDEDAQ